MKSRNICKFIEESHGEALTTTSFICESNPNTMRRNVTLSENRMIIISNGSGEFNFDGKVFKMSKGDVLFAFEGEHFFAEPSDGLEYLYVGIKGTRCHELFKRFRIGSVNRQFSSREGLIAFWAEAISRAGETNIDLISESVVLYSFAQLVEGDVRRRGIAEQLIDIIDEEFSDPKLSLRDISERLGYNDKYISHTFKEKTGRGFSEYLRTVRIRHAVFLMDNGLESVKNIACFCGFDDQLYFSNVFKKVTGVSPTAYINKISKDKHSGD